MWTAGGQSLPGVQFRFFFLKQERENGGDSRGDDRILKRWSVADHRRLSEHQPHTHTHLSWQAECAQSTVVPREDAISASPEHGGCAAWMRDAFTYVRLRASVRKPEPSFIRIKRGAPFGVGEGEGHGAGRTLQMEGGGRGLRVASLLGAASYSRARTIASSPKDAAVRLRERKREEEIITSVALLYVYIIILSFLSL